MAKYKKQEVHMIDMSGRLKMKIVHEEFTSEDELEWEREMEENLKRLLSSAMADTQKPQKDADYFIREYGNKFIGRNPDNIKNRLQLYNKYLEQD